MTVNTSSNTYAIATGTKSVNNLISQPRDPGALDVNYPYNQFWKNSTTNALWMLVQFNSGGGTAEAIWRALPPVVVSNRNPASSDYLYPLGQPWDNSAANSYWIMTSNPTPTTGNWVNISSAIATIDGDVGYVSGSTVTFTGGSSGAVFVGDDASTMTESFNYLSLPTTTSTNGQILIGAVPVLQTYGSGNTFAGGAGNFSLATASCIRNTAVGKFSSIALTTGEENSALGYGTLANLNTGNFNTVMGSSSGLNIQSGSGNSAYGTSSLSTCEPGSNNTSIGYASLQSLTTGSTNTALGLSAGASYSGSESSNLAIANTGSTGESNVIRIGTQGTGAGQQNNCYVAGIYESTTVTANSPLLVLCDNTGKLTTSTTIGAFTSINIKPITSTSTYTPTTGMSYCIVEVVGGGGGGGGVADSTASIAAAAGGGAGGYARKTLSASAVGGSQTVTVGAGGTGAASGNNSGGTGGTTSFGSIFSASGGVGGAGSAASSPAISNGGTGGIGTGGDLNIAGEYGANGWGVIVGSGGFCFGGFGGNSLFGAGAHAIANTTGVGNSPPAGAYGAGAGGSIGQNGAAQAGAAGSAGICVITEFIYS